MALKSCLSKIPMSPGQPFKRGLATMLEGKVAAQKILGQVEEDIRDLAKVGVRPSLVPLVVGDVSASQIYVKNKKAAAEKAGIDCRVLSLPTDTSEEKVLKRVGELNRDGNVHGIIVQLPLPPHVDERTVCNAVSVEKDVDGFTTRNLGSLVQGVGLGNSFVPCTPLAVLKILQTCVDLEFKGLNAAVAGRSHNVGLPIAMILAHDAAKGGLDLTTTVCHRYTPPEELRRAVAGADVVVAAAGVPGLITGDMVKPGACVIDVGINRIVDPATGKAKVVGDVGPDVAEVVGWLTPVPGGVGPCTVACLLYNTVKAAKYSTFKAK